MSAGWDINTTLAFWSLVVGIIGTVLAAWAFLPGWKDYQEWLKADPAYREKTVAALKDQRWIERYRNGLAAGLDWLDWRFGEADSARALGVCTVISLCYAWAAFFLGYGLGAPGRLGEIELLPTALVQQQRLILVAIAVALPVFAFLIGRKLGGWADRAERRFKAGLLRRRRRSGPTTTLRFERRYRLTSTLILLAVFLALLVPVFLGGEDHPLFDIAIILLLGMLFAAGPVWGLAIAKYIPMPWLKGPAATGAGALALAVAVAGVGAVALAGAGAGALAGALAGAIGAVTAGRWARQDRRGAFAGGVGAVLALGLFGTAFAGNVDSAGGVLIITFFLLLPLANGIWDWLSWRVSRWLGRDLLQGLNEDRHVWTITWHALADFGFALVFLATLAFALAFGFEGYNQFAEARSGREAYDLATFVREAARAPWSLGFWLTAMLLSTLVPTFLHFALLLAGPLVLLISASPKRAELAAALTAYETTEHRDAILQNVAWHLARSQYLAWAGAIVLTILLLSLFAGFISLIHQGGLADYVADIAIFAIDVARWCF